ncbi:hypothetical protein KY289_027518 [Solanum tuberosum]|nr:hypothetical protein KY289_027518 [Solanum tuberosum]
MDSSPLIFSSFASIPFTSKSELEHDINHFLVGDGFDLVSRIKTVHELSCPGVVSCADIDPRLSHEKSHRRIDSLVSQATSVEGKLARANDTEIPKSRLQRPRNGCIIGFVHCKEFANRIFAKSDPTMNPKLVDRLRGICANYTTNPDMAAFHDVITPGTFDNMLFKNLMNGLGVLGSVQLLLSDPRTKQFVEKYAKDSLPFSADFARDMEKLNVYKVKVDNQGDVMHLTLVGNKRIPK